MQVRSHIELHTLLKEIGGLLMPATKTRTGPKWHAQDAEIPSLVISAMARINSYERDALNAIDDEDANTLPTKKKIRMSNFIRSIVQAIARGGMALDTMTTCAPTHHRELPSPSLSSNLAYEPTAL